MGRTRRKRLHKNEDQRNILDQDENTINLIKWLVKNGWKNESKLSLKSFNETGRGVYSKKNMHSGSILISIPFEVMITYSTVRDYLLCLHPTCQLKLTIHELLCVFLMFESKHRNTFWSFYIDSLPENLPALPWLSSKEEIQFYPNDLREQCANKLEHFEDSIQRVRLFVTKYNFTWDPALFKWAYVLVNTRAVYVDPLLFGTNLVSNDFLLDAPSMALCPFLDMFNHSYFANSEAVTLFEKGSHLYQLTTLVKYKKYEQIFILYGPHDNRKLLMEYGFFIRGNVMDVVKFELQEVLKVLRLCLYQVQFKFIQNHNLQLELYIGKNGPSFNLKALLFITYFHEYKNYASIIFSSNYPAVFDDILKKHIIDLLEHKIVQYQTESKHFSNNIQQEAECSILLKGFLEYRVQFLNELINDYSS